MAEAEFQFRGALEEYENKNYKKALVGVDKILKKHPMHSQTYALKALILAFYHPTNQPNKDVNALVPLSSETMHECDELINTAVKYGPANSVSAHLAALYYRQVKNYEKAAHFYTITIANNPGNKAVLRDLSSCLSQLRAYKSLAKTRLDYLQAEPGYRANYSSTAAAYDLNSDYKGAIKICDQVEDLIKDKLIDDDLVENSECIIYKITLFIKLGEDDKALELINTQLQSTEKFRCLDVDGLLDLKYHVLMKQEKFSDAQLVIRALLKRNPDNITYYNDLVKCLKIEKNDDLKLKLFAKLAKFYPKSDLPKFLPLTFLKGEEFETYLQHYLCSLFKRGVPSIFSNIKPLYKKHSNRAIILKTVESFEQTEKNPLILTWIKYFISQHYYKLKDYDSALAKINEAIKMTPTLIEVYMFKARILKHQGKLIKAAEEMNTARTMDLQDRFVNSRTAKYYLRADLIDKALEVATLFTKNDDDPTGLKDLHMLQCCWFVSEYAESLTRIFKKKLAQFKEIKENTQSSDSTDGESENIHLVQKQIEAYLGLSLQRYFSLFSIYAEYYEDQFDFHFYSFRKGTLRTYFEMIKWSDELYHQAFIGRVYSDLMSLVAYTVENNTILAEALDFAGFNSGKRSKKDKKDEIKWKDHMIHYNKVFDSDVFGQQLVEAIVQKRDYLKLDIIEKLISRKDGEHGKPETLDFLYGEFNYEFISGKYVVALASVRKVKALTDTNNEDGERAKVALESMIAQINRFIEKPSEDPKTASLQKVVKLGLTRI